MRIDLYEQGGYSGGGITENGGNISGPLVLAGNPSQTLEAVPKQYVDAYFTSISANNFTAGTIGAANLPAFTGDIIKAEGSTVLSLANSPVTPGSYAKVNINAKGFVTGGSSLAESDIPFGVDWSKIKAETRPNTLSGYGIFDGVSVNGSTMTGFLSLTQGATLSGHAVRKQYVDSLVSNGGISVGDILRKPYSTTPSGFLKCNGAELLKADYANLYAVIGDSFKHETVPGNGRPWEQQYQINATQSGDLSPWTVETGVLPASMYYSAAAVTKNRVYLVGLWAGAYSGGVYTAPINADGSIGTWTTGNTLPSTMAITTLIATKNRLYAISGYSDNSTNVPYTYTAVINADGTLGTWSSGPSLPAGVGFTVSFVTKNRVYVCGGSAGSAASSVVYTASINSDGTLNAWTTGTSLPTTISQAALFVTKNRVFICGGTQGGFGNNAIYTAPINADGTIGSWVLNNVHLPEAIVAGQYFTVKNTVYIIDGYNALNVTSSRMYYASIKSDGTLSEFASSPNVLPYNMWGGETFVVKNKVYLCAGQIGNGGSASNVIMSATLVGGSNDYSSYYTEDTTNYMTPGSGKPWQNQYGVNSTQTTAITGWVNSTSMPGNNAYGAVIVTKNRVYVYDGAYLSNTMYTAVVNADGTLGSWSTITGTLPIAVGSPQAIVTKNRAYIIGGYVSGGASAGNVFTAPINADGTLGTWVATGSLPGGIAWGSAIVTRDRVYYLGGITGTSNYVSTVYTATINTDGTIGAWVTGTSLPITVGNHCVFISKNRIYLVGGNSGASTWYNSVYTATISSEGYIGPWSLHGTIPTAVSASHIFATTNRVYLFAGYNGNTSQVNTTWSAPLDSNGVLGAWAIDSSLPSNLGYAQVFAVKDKIYICGGLHATNTLNAGVRVATISNSLNDYSPYYDGTIIPNNVPSNSNKFNLPDYSAEEPFGSYSYIKY